MFLTTSIDTSTILVYNTCMENEITLLGESTPVPASEFVPKMIGHRPFVVQFVKKNGEIRSGKFDLKPRKRWKTIDGSWKKLNGNGRKSNPDQYLLAFDLDKKDWRLINYSTMKYLKVGRRKYEVQVFENEDYRIFGMRRIHKSSIH